MKKLIAALCLIPSLAFAQSAVRQSGSVTNNDLAKWQTNGVIKDVGGILGDNIGLGANPFSVTDNNGNGVCSNNAVTSGSYSSICLGHDGSGNGVIDYTGTGTLTININGSTFTLPGSSSCIGCGSMAGQNSNAVAITGGSISNTTISTGAATITGGSINNTPIGGSTPSTGTFSTLNSTNGNMNGTVGATTPHTGTFTTLTTTGAANLNNVNGLFYADNYGVDRTGVSDSTTAMQNAITAACAGSGALFVGPGTVTTGGLTVPCGLTLIGAGARNTTFARTGGTETLFNVTANTPVTFRDWECNSSVTATDGACIAIQPSVGENEGSIFNNLYCKNENYCIKTVAASHFVIDNLFAINCVTDCVLVQNTNNVDSGDSVITNSTFLEFQGNVCANTGIGIHQLSSGGLKISNSKFTCGIYNYKLELAAGAGTSILQVSNNSFESGTISALDFEATNSTTSSFKFVSITGNEIDCQGGGSCIRIPTASTPGWLLFFSVVGNTGGTSNTGGPNPGNWMLAQAGAYITVTSNAIQNMTGNASSFGVEVLTPTVACTVTNNQTNGFGSNAIINTCAGGSP